MVADADLRSLLDMVRIEAKAEEMCDGSMDTATLVALRVLEEARKAGFRTLAEVVSALSSR